MPTGTISNEASSEAHYPDDDAIIIISPEKQQKFLPDVAASQVGPQASACAC
jgi:hypothetical protein